MNADGSDPHAVTANETAALSPEFLPGGRIIYSRTNKQNLDEIVSVNSDGSGATIESDPSKNSYRGPAHGPSKGTFVAYGTGPVEPEPPEGYHRAPGFEAGQLFRDGPVLVTAPFRRTLPDRQIDFNPIRYFSAVLNPRENLILHTAPLTNDAADDLFPVFSPTANQIAFASNRDNPKADVFDVYLLDLDADGAPGKVRRITHDEGQHGHLQYSYDGKWLIFASEQGGISDEQPIAPAAQLYGELYAYRIKDGTMIRLTNNKWEEGVPSWEAPLRAK